MKYFHNPDNYPWVQILKDSYPDIKREFQRWPKWLRAPRTMFHYGRKLEANSAKWHVIPLMGRNKPIWFMRLFFPKTYALIKKIPVGENLSFSIFYPGAETVKHKGWSKDIVRVHLGIDMNPDSALHCGDEFVSLQNGEVLIFEDGEEHWAYNRGKYERTILLFDVWKKDIGL
jgi:beta-hydroxylase